jgi:hypothetical protein
VLELIDTYINKIIRNDGGGGNRTAYPQYRNITVNLTTSGPHIRGQKGCQFVACVRSESGISGSFILTLLNNGDNGDLVQSYGIDT